MMKTYRSDWLPGAGDEETWPTPNGHPLDPRNLPEGTVYGTDVADDEEPTPEDRVWSNGGFSTSLLSDWM